MMAWRYLLYKDVLPLTAMVAVECSIVGLNTLFKAASLNGMSYYVFIFYSYLASTLILLPFPFIFPSTAVLTSSKFPLFVRICLLGLIGLLSDVLGYKGIQYSSPTLASAMGNLLPAFTFTLAVIFRMERLALRRSSTQAKIIGTLVSISGALVVTLYKGPTIFSTSSTTPSILLQQPLGSSQSNWVVGGLLLATEYLLVSIWFIIQTQVIKMYPAELTVVIFFNLCGIIIAAPVCFIAEPNLSAWRLGPDVALIAVVYSGFFGYGFSSVIHTWCLRLKGPVYVAIFKPLSIAIAAIMSFIFLGDALYLGGVIGATIISIGFYAVIWGKAKEEEIIEEYVFSSLASQSDGKIPLLQSHKIDGM